jgi:hypothetical protein
MMAHLKPAGYISEIEHLRKAAEMDRIDHECTDARGLL